MTDFSLSSPSFSFGSEIPKKHGYKHGNISPPLSISSAPENCASFAIIMDDPDAMVAVGKVWVHWVIWNISPQVNQINESSTPDNSIEGKNDFDEIGYGGPAPPDKRHTYIFKLYALDSVLSLEEGSTKSQLEESMKGHILVESKLEGTFAP